MEVFTDARGVGGKGGTSGEHGEEVETSGHDLLHALNYNECNLTLPLSTMVCIYCGFGFMVFRYFRF